MSRLDSGLRIPPLLPARAAVVALACLVLASTSPAWGEDRLAGPPCSTLCWTGFFDASAFAASGGEEDASSAGLESSEIGLVVVSRFPIGPGNEDQEWRYKLSFLTDISVGGQRRQVGDTAPEEIDVALERALFRYEFSDLWTVSAGQFHTPLGHWRDVYHRGRWLHVAASRPVMMEFDGRFLPAYLLGALLEGTSWAGGWNLSYRLGLGDGRPGLTTAERTGVPESDGAAVFGLSIEPARLHGFSVGAAVYFDRLVVEGLRPDPPLAAGVDEVDETIVSGHLAWSRGITRLVGEVATVRHEAGGRRLDSDAYYLEAAYGLRAFRRRLALYNRIEELRIEPEDPVFQTSSKRIALVGARFDLSRRGALETAGRRQRIALKAEFRQVSARNVRDTYELLLQASLTFNGRQ